MSIKTAQFTITIQNDDGSSIKIGEIVNVSGISSPEFKKFPDKCSFDGEMNEEEFRRQFLGEFKPIEKE